MKIKRIIIWIFITIVLLSACGGAQDQPPPNKAAETPAEPSVPAPAPAERDRDGTSNESDTVEYGEPFRMGAGDSITLAGDGLRITFAAVSQDSRCPTNVQCIIAGWATVILEIESGNGDVELLELSIGDISPERASQQQVGDTVIELLEVTPYPRDPGKIAADQYRISLLVFLKE